MSGDALQRQVIAAGILGEGTSNLVFHALRDDGLAACSSYLLVYRAGKAAAEIPPDSRCKSKACQKRFADADAARRQTVGRQG